MADSILRLKVESQEYDAKIKRAAAGLQHMEQYCRKMGVTMDYLTDEEKKFIGSLGQMETVSKSARGRLSELTTAFTDLRSQYNRLTDEEKNGDFGRTLNASLEQLKGRIKDAKDELKDIDNELKDSKSIMEQFKEKLTVNIDAMKLLELGLKAARGALDVAKEGFMSSEANVDEWGRTVESARDVYEGFLTSINTGDISGFLSRIDDIVAAARSAYDELDKLGTLQTIQGPQKSAQQTENERMRLILRTGTWIAPANGAKNQWGLNEGDKLSKEQLKVVEYHLKQGLKSATTIIEREIKQSGNAIEALFGQQAQKVGISLDEFKKGTSNWAEFSKRMDMAQKYQKFEAQHTTSSYTSGGPIMFQRDAVANPYAAYKKWADFRVDKEGDGSYQKIVELIKQRDQQVSQRQQMVSQGFMTMNRLNGYRPSLKDGSGSGTGNGTDKTFESQLKITDLVSATLGTTESMNELNAQLAMYKKALANATTQFDADAAQKGIDETKKKIDAQPMALSLGWDTQSVVDLKDHLTEIMDKMRSEMKPLEIGVKTTSTTTELTKDAKANMQAWSAAASAVSSLSRALQGLENPSAKIAGIVGQAIANIALTFSSSLKGTVTPWDWIAAAIAGTATMMSTIMSIKSATKGGFAEGGIVPGNSYSGDRLNTAMYGINSGELILNKAQQNNVAAALDGGGPFSNLQLTSRVSGRDLVLTINNQQTVNNKPKLNFK